MEVFNPSRNSHWSARRPSQDARNLLELSDRFNAHSISERHYFNDEYSPSLETSPRGSWAPSLVLTPPPSADSAHPFPSLDSQRSSQCLKSRSHSLSTMSTSSIRQQRQRAVRRQCTSTHLLEVKQLVARMVANGEIEDTGDQHSSENDKSEDTSESSATSSTVSEEDAQARKDEARRARASRGIRKCTARPRCKRNITT